MDCFLTRIYYLAYSRDTAVFSVFYIELFILIFNFAGSPFFHTNRSMNMVAGDVNKREVTAGEYGSQGYGS